jgi:hypothetical protein
MTVILTFGTNLDNNVFPGKTAGPNNRMRTMPRADTGNLNYGLFLYDATFIRIKNLELATAWQ